jgi:hypothetical protein
MEPIFPRDAWRKKNNDEADNAVESSKEEYQDSQDGIQLPTVDESVGNRNYASELGGRTNLHYT